MPGPQGVRSILGSADLCSPRDPLATFLPSGTDIPLSSTRVDGEGALMTNVIIKNGSVVTMDEALGVLPRADVHVVDGEIVAIGPDLDVGDAQEIDASNAVVAPGF